MDCRGPSSFLSNVLTWSIGIDLINANVACHVRCHVSLAVIINFAITNPDRIGGVVPYVVI